jgi:D-alanyl-D-alanine carboxypeptidase
VTALRQSTPARRLALLLAVALVGLLPSCSHMHTRAAARAEAAFASCFPPGAPGGVILVSVAGRTVLRSAYGLADVEREVAVEAHQAFPVGSVTKQFTAAGVLRLADRGAVHLDDPIGRYVRGLSPAVAAITIAQLLSHTSGLADYVTDSEISNRLGSRGDPETLAAAIASRPLHFEPGTDWAYSNTNYALLGLVLERVSGESCAAFLERDLFAPLALEATTLGPPAPGEPSLVGYELQQGRYVEARTVDPSWSSTAGGLWSSVEDLARWNESLFGGRVLSPLLLARMTRPTALATGGNAAYGFGLRTGRLDRYALLWHDGAVPGYYAITLYLPEPRIFVAIVSNGGSNREDIERAAREVALTFATS